MRKKDNKPFGGIQLKQFSFINEAAAQKAYMQAIEIVENKFYMNTENIVKISGQVVSVPDWFPYHPKTEWQLKEKAAFMHINKSKTHEEFLMNPSLVQIEMQEKDARIKELEEFMNDILTYKPKWATKEGFIKNAKSIASKALVIESKADK